MNNSTTMSNVSDRRAGGVSPPRDLNPGQTTRSRAGFSGSLRPPLAVVCLLSFAATANAQEILDVRVGFEPLSKNAPTHKVGFWTPVAVHLKGPAAGDTQKYSLAVEADDSEDCGVVTILDVGLPNAGEERTVNVDVKPGRTRGDVRVTLSNEAGRIVSQKTVATNAGDLGDYLYLNLGNRIDALPDALDYKEKRAIEDGKHLGRQSRFAVSQEGEATSLGYDGIDLIVASGGWQGSAPDVWNWVERGGRLVVAVDPDRRSFEVPKQGWIRAGRLLTPFLAKNLAPVEAWAGVQNKPFPARGQAPVPIARMEPEDFGLTSWDVLVKLEDKSAGNAPLPLVARSPFGFGSVTVIAFPLDSGAFAAWSGRTEFLRALVDQIGPRYVLAEKAKETGWRTEAGVDDWGAQLQRDLDAFDVPSWSFTAVAFLILGYLLLVSAGDYLILRRLLGRLETTWITLPLAVVGVSIGAYLALDLAGDRVARVNQISLLDLDLRTFRDTAPRVEKMYHGSTFFTIRSERIRRLDVAVKPGKQVDPEGEALPVVSWFGRADDGPAGIGRAGGHGFSGNSYRSPIDHESLVAVPFAFRATKSFTAEWSIAPRQDPLAHERVARPALLSAELFYHPREANFKVTGTIESRLPFDLETADLFVFDRVYPIAGGLKKGEKRTIQIKEIDNGIFVGDWRTQGVTPGKSDPGAALKNIMFHERFDPPLKIRNHLLRRLDWSWRLRDDPRILNVRMSSLGVRDAILVGHAKFESGAMSELQGESSPAKIVIESKDATLSRDTYLRAILPMRPHPW